MRPARPEDGIAWITGASSGIGLALARALLAAGWRVGVTARRAQPLQDLATAWPGRVIVAAADVTDPAAMEQALAEITRQAGAPVALAILNAGTYTPMGAADFDLPVFRRHVEVNVMGTATALSVLLPDMIRRGRGQIAITASVAGFVGLPNAVAYGPTKAALISLAESLKFDLDRAGVLLQVICPGFVKTPLTDGNDFPMPFIIGADDAAARILRGLAGGRFQISFPWQMSGGLKLLRLLPYAAFFALVGWATAGKTGSKSA